MNQDAPLNPTIEPESIGARALSTTAQSIYDHFVGLQQLQSWMRQN